MALTGTTRRFGLLRLDRCDVVDVRTKCRSRRGILDALTRGPCSFRVLSSAEMRTAGQAKTLLSQEDEQPDLLALVVFSADISPCSQGFLAIFT
jgi:hypothetical protein